MSTAVRMSSAMNKKGRSRSLDSALIPRNNRDNNVNNVEATKDTVVKEQVDSDSDEYEETIESEKVEKTAPTWDALPYDIKEMIIDNLDFISRNKLKWSSRANLELVSSIPLCLEKIEIYDGGLSGDSHDGIIIVFDDLNIDTKQRCWGLVFEGENYWHQNVSVPHWMSHYSPLWLLTKWLERFLVTTKIRCEKFRPNFDPPTALIDSNDIYRIRASELVFDQPNMDRIVKWLKIVAPGVRKLEARGGMMNYDRSAQLTGIGMLEKVINCTELTINLKNDITDDQLLNFKANVIELNNSSITPQGVQKLIKKWIIEDYPVDSKFECDLKNMAMVLDGLTYERMEANHPKVKIAMSDEKAIIVEKEYSLTVNVVKN